MKKDLIKKIIEKKEFSDLPKKDVELIFEKFNNENYSDEEKIKLTRNFLRKIFSSFTSRKLLSIKNKNEEWILRKHLSTRERLPYYEEIYKKIFHNFKKKVTVIDLGAGVNGFSYKRIKNVLINFKVNYIAIEAVGQLSKLVNNYFENEKINGKSFHLSLLELGEIKKIIKKTSKPRVVFLFKTIDSLEILKRDYSKKLISEIAPLTDKFVVSFATRSMISKREFKVNRNWILNFLKDNFKILDDFKIGGERYIIFKN